MGSSIGMVSTASASPNTELKCGLMWDADGGFDQAKKDLGVSQQIVGLADGDGAIDARFGGGTFTRPGGKESGPFGEFGCHLSEEAPCVARLAASPATWHLGSRTSGKHCGRTPQCCEMRAGVTLGGAVTHRRLEQAVSCHRQ